VRVCVVGGGLAGALLSWRLARAAPAWRIELVTGTRGTADATAASGGAVRAYEPDPEQRRLATASLVELLRSQTLRDWAGFCRVDSIYLRRSPDGLAAAVADIESALPGSAQLRSPAELERRGWADLPPGCAAVHERQAGYLSPDRFRSAVLADAVRHHRLTVLEGAVGAIDPRGGGAIACGLAGRDREYDIVVVAAGAWTPKLLDTFGLPHSEYRTKAIRYAIHPVAEACPAEFVDECTGLFGRPTAEGGLLLGLPTTDWDVDPDSPAPVLPEAAAELARARFPALGVGRATARVSSTDCYADHHMLSLRPVFGTDHRLFTFTGGAGGSAKTALAASLRAASQLTESDQPDVLASVGPRKGQT
jgi:glycine/D-amino acid oxidase-like deaminating enzyme